MKLEEIIHQWRGGLIVSCQARADSPLSRPDIIGALALAAQNNGAVGVQIDGPANIRATRNTTRLPILGLEKMTTPDSEVYLTPTFECAARIAFTGADVIALDATERPRPKGEEFMTLVTRIHTRLKKPVMANVATFGQGMKAIEEAGVAFVSTALSGYAPETAEHEMPDFRLVELLAARTEVPVICEGRLRSPEDVQRAFNSGAFAVVVGAAITGVDWLVRHYAALTPRQNEAAKK